MVELRQIGPLERRPVRGAGRMGDGCIVVMDEPFRMLSHERRVGRAVIDRAVVRHLFGLGFDGFRCDTAYGVPPEVWRRLIAGIKAPRPDAGIKASRPDAVLVAETLGCSPWATVATAGAGFDYVFNSAKWWVFRGPWLLEQRELIGQRVATIGELIGQRVATIGELIGQRVATIRELIGQRVATIGELIGQRVATIGFAESHDTPRLAEELDGNENALAPGQGVVLVTSALGL